ncbi:MAG: aspartate carbamoyltransferase [Oscillospiraceae bacterium]|nr:aspartate carbamoyltransferase [Oscillospiraceae bacterium]
MLNGNLIDLNDLPISEWNRIIALAQEIIKRPELYSEKCYGKILATLFYEPSTRTQMSFQTAMLKLGGRIIGFDDPQNSSVSKGESLKDTITIVSNYADMIVLRHPNEGAARAASLYASCPVINAGDGGHLHPSQTLTDLLTLSVEKGRLTDLVVGICGDLVNGRTVHSLIKALSCYRGNSFVLISTPNLRVPSYIKDIMSAAGCPFTEVDSLSEAIPMLDVLYMTRIQRERFTSEEEYLREKDVYRLDREKLMSARSDLRILHPLPRVDEIAIEVDDDPRAAYFRQASYGVYARMALLIRLTTPPEYPVAEPAPKQPLPHHCENPRCITQKEGYLPGLFTSGGDMLVCDYCDSRLLI